MPSLESGASSCHSPSSVMAASGLLPSSQLISTEKGIGYQSGDDDPRNQPRARLVPPEIWVIIFKLVLGREPFRLREMKAYLRLRSVCRFWNDLATTSGICTGLDIALDDWVVGFDPSSYRAYVEARLAPWLAIISPLQPYFLRMTCMHPYRLSVEALQQLTQLLMTTTPSPTAVMLDDATLPPILSSISSYDTITTVELFLRDDLDHYPRLQSLSQMLPKVETFIIGAQFRLTIRFQHTSLRCLILHDMRGSPEDLQSFLEGLPSLRELYVSNTSYHLPNLDQARRATKTLPSIEVLVISGEKLAEEILSHFTLPSLKFFGLEASDSVQDQDVAIWTYSDFLSRSCLTKCTVSIKGIPTYSFFTAFVESLPSYVLLHCCAYFMPSDEVVCLPSACRVEGIYCPNLGWLDGQAMQRDDTPFKISVLSNRLGPEDKARRKQLEELGYVVEVDSMETIEAKLRSQVPRMSIDWDLWSL